MATLKYVRTQRLCPQLIASQQATTVYDTDVKMLMVAKNY